MREFLARVKALLGRRHAISEDLREELEHHLALMEEDLRARGLSPAEAHRQARLQSGQIEQVREQAMDSWRLGSLDTWLQDAKQSVRLIRRSPAFFITVGMILALGIGANTAIFSVVHAVMLRPLPYPASERLVKLEESTPYSQGISVSWGNFRHWQQESRSFEAMAGYNMGMGTLTGWGEPLDIRAAWVSSEWTSMLGMKPLLGRFFAEQEQQTGAARVAVISSALWQSRLGADPKIIGKSLSLQGKSYEVIGVAAPAWQFVAPIDVFLSLGAQSSDASPRAQHNSMRVLARLKPGVTLQSAREDLDRIMTRLAAAEPGPESTHRVFAQFLLDSTVGEARSSLYLLMAAVVLVLLTACSNVAGMIFARNTTRARELAVRAALGAGQKRLIRQLLVENLAIVALGGMAGVLVAHLGIRALIATAPVSLPRLAETRLDPAVLAFAAFTTLATGLITGLAPVWSARRIELASALNSVSRSATSSRGSARFREVLVIAQVALTVVLSFGSLLVVKSLIQVQSVDPGFAAKPLLLSAVSLPSARYPSDAEKLSFYRRLADRLRATPGFSSASLTHCAPATGDCSDWFYSLPGRPAPEKGGLPLSVFNSADPSLLTTAGMHLLAGRWISEADSEGTAPVVVVNETLSRAIWSDGFSVGQRLKFGGAGEEGATYEIVGVVRDIAHEGLDSEPRAEVFIPFAQRPTSRAMIVVRTAQAPAIASATLKKILATLDPLLPLQEVRTAEEALGSQLERRRFGTWLLTLFASIGLFLAGIGIYGLLSYWVSIRRPEIAIRMAMGAGRSRIAALVGKQTGGLAAIGCIAGAAGAWSVAHWMESFVFGINAHSPWVLALCIVPTLLIALAATLFPTLRAVKTDPARQLYTN